MLFKDVIGASLDNCKIYINSVKNAEFFHVALTAGIFKQEL